MAANRTRPVQAVQRGQGRCFVNTESGRGIFESGDANAKVLMILRRQTRACQTISMSNTAYSSEIRWSSGWAAFAIQALLDQQIILRFAIAFFAPKLANL